MSEFHRYKRLGFVEARAYVPGEDLNVVSVSVPDKIRASMDGGMVARNPDNHADQWYIAPEYFAKHFDQSPEPTTLNDLGERHEP